MPKILLTTCVTLLLFGCKSKADLVVIETDVGNITIQVDFDHAPKHAENFVKLVKEGFYDSLMFHHIIAGTLIQGGDPNTKDDDQKNDGLGGPGYLLDQEVVLKHLPGSVGAAQIKEPANPQNKSNGSQFYICLKNIPIWDGNYTVFGKVVDNIEVVQKISSGPIDLYNFPKTPIYIKRAYLK